MVNLHVLIRFTPSVLLASALLLACGGSPQAETSTTPPPPPPSPLDGLDAQARYQWAVGQLPLLGELSSNGAMPDLSAVPSRGGNTVLFAKHGELGLDNPEQCAQLVFETTESGLRTRFTARGRAGRPNLRGEVYELTLGLEATRRGPTAVRQASDPVTGDESRLGRYRGVDEEGVHYDMAEANFTSIRCSRPSNAAVTLADGSVQTCPWCDEFEVLLNGPGVVEQLTGAPISAPGGGNQCPAMLDEYLVEAVQGHSVYRPGNSGITFYSSAAACRR